MGKYLDKYEDILKESNQAKKSGLLKIRTANQCIEEAKLQAIPKQLCGNLWFQNETCILFADTNVGKSILAVQIADNISRANAVGVFGSSAKAQKILYLDFELSDKQFEKRYSQEFENHYSWDSNFLRVVINVDFIDFEDFEKQLFTEVESTLKEKGAKVIIVDNITYLRMQSTEQGKEALPLMKHLTLLKQKYGLSLLVLAHTPKRLNPSSALTLNDLAGSKHLSNFADSIFCIGRSSQNTEWRYIKQLKARSQTVQEEVFVCHVSKLYNFLKFEFIKPDYENNHLIPKNEADKEMVNAVLALKKETPNLSLQEIADKVGTNKMKVKRIIDRNNL